MTSRWSLNKKKKKTYAKTKKSWPNLQVFTLQDLVDHPKLF